MKQQILVLCSLPLVGLHAQTLDTFYADDPFNYSITGDLRDQAAGIGWAGPDEVVDPESRWEVIGNGLDSPAPPILLDRAGYTDDGARGADGYEGSVKDGSGDTRRLMTTDVVDGFFWVSVLVDYAADGGGRELRIKDENQAPRLEIALDTSRPLLSFTAVDCSFDVSGPAFDPGVKHVLTLVEINYNSDGWDRMTLWINPELTGGFVGLGAPEVVADMQCDALAVWSDFVLAGNSPRIDGLRLAYDREDPDVALAEILTAGDGDQDGVPKPIDNCANVANADQLDVDGDGIGNACDGDFNNDCIVDALDFRFFRFCFVGGDLSCDLNGDGAVTGGDFQILRDLRGQVPGPIGGDLPQTCDVGS